MLNLFLASILIPAVASVMLWRRPRQPRAGWVATLVLATGIVAFSFLAAPWGYFGLPIRYGVMALFIAALVVSLRRPVDPERSDDPPMRMFVKVGIGVIFGSVAVSVLRAHSVPDVPLDLVFPLTRGDYVVVHGGSTPAANTYVGRGPQSFGVDVVKLSPSGMPGHLTGETIVAPCDGTVVSPKPFRLRCGNATVELSPVEPLAATAAVKRGTPIARAAARQLHIHAERNGRPLPMTFAGKWLVRNHLIRRQGPPRS